MRQIKVTISETGMTISDDDGNVCIWRDGNFKSMLDDDVDFVSAVMPCDRETAWQWAGELLGI